jgi:dTDP-4-amino-4,6-dideoxygalactose transaminase
MSKSKELRGSAGSTQPPQAAAAIHVGRPNIGSREKFKAYVDGIFDRQWLSNGGPLVQELERRIAEHIGVKHCIAMCNGTIALEIAIRALDLKDEVIVPSYTFIATAHALQWQGMTPVFADIDPKTHNLDPAAVRRMITPKTTGIIGVHVWGRPAPHEELAAIAEEFNLKLMYDAAHAFGCSYKGKMVGGLGRCEVLSFHATKFFNTFEGGAIVTNDSVLAEKMSLMRNFGFQGYDNVIHPGTNGKMVEICAAMGLVNLDEVDATVQANRKNYEEYRRQLSGVPGISVIDYDDQEKNNFQYVVVEVADECVMTRDEVVDVLHQNGVLARKYFWPGCHGMKPYRELYPHARLVLPNTELVARRVVVLPTGTTLELRKVQEISAVIRDEVFTRMKSQPSVG